MNLRITCWLLLVAVESTTAKAGPREGNLPAYFRTEVRSGEVYVEFKWDSEPGFERGAAEFSLSMFKGDTYLEPVTGTDYSPNEGFRTNLPCAYRDVYNHGSGNPATVFAGLVEYCGRAVDGETLAAATAVWSQIVLAQDEAWQFSVGTNCPGELQANKQYWFRYFTKEKSDSQGYAFAWIQQDGIANILNCPLLSGGVPWREGTRPMWINRLCVPTGLFPNAADPSPVRPGDVVQTDGTACIRSDADEFFELQSVPMFGTLVGDCNSSDPLVGNEHYDFSTNACAAECGLEHEPCCAGSCLMPGLACEPGTNTCVAGPCVGQVGGEYCGSSLPGYNGNASDLVTCTGGVVASAIPCPVGCHASAPGVNDYCMSAPIDRISVRRLHGSNGQGCGNPTADWDHCHTLTGSSCVAGQSPALTYGTEIPPDLGQFWVLPLGLVAGNPDEITHEGVLLSRLDACYRDADTRHVLEPQDQLKIEGIENAASVGINGWSCVRVGYVRTGSIVGSDPAMIPVYRINIDDKSSRFVTPMNSADDPSCGVDNTGIAWFAWNGP